MGKIFGHPDALTLAQFHDVMSRALDGALMGDAHVGYIMPIGGVAIYPNEVSVAGVGKDIGCGNDAIRTDLTLEEWVGFTRAEADANPSRVIGNHTLNQVADAIFNTVSFGVGRSNKADDAPVDHELFHDPAWWIIPNIGGYRDDLMQMAREQLGTVGSGNHYVDVFVDEEDYIWIGIHCGSRGFGNIMCENFMALAQGLPWGTKTKEVEALLSLDSQLGQDYWAIMQLAGKYAAVGRAWALDKAHGLVGGNAIMSVRNHHNFAWKEQQRVGDEYQEVIVVRKGATPAFPGQKGFVGGSMGDNAVILQGADYDYGESYGDVATADMSQEDQEKAFFSTVHGSGRIIGRRNARDGAKLVDPETGKDIIDPMTGKVKRGQPVSVKTMHEMMERRGILLRGSNQEESPECYRPLKPVLDGQGWTIQVLHTLRPLISLMAPKGTRDPYKD